MLDTNAPPLFAVRDPAEGRRASDSPLSVYRTDDAVVLRRISNGHPGSPLNKVVVTLILKAEGKLREEPIMFYPLATTPRRSPELPPAGPVLAIRHPVAGNIIGIGWIPEGRTHYCWRYTRRSPS